MFDDPIDLFCNIVILAAIIGPFYYGFRYYFRARLIEDTPTSKARNVAQGYAELVGKGQAMPGEPIVAQLTKIPCLWYKYQISDQNGPIASGESHGIFYIEDENGICIVDPDDAEMYGTRTRAWTELGHNEQRRFHEETLPIGTTLYVIGDIALSDYYAHAISLENEVGEKVVDWKQDYKRLLERFDTNGDGELCFNEWQAVLKAAEKEVIEERGERLKVPAVAYIRKPRHSKKPYIIATYPPKQLARKFRWYAFIYFFIFFIVGGISVAHYF